MTDTAHEVSEQPIEGLIEALDSIADGDRATEALIVIGQRSVPFLEQYLLDGRPRSLALPRCRAVRALGELGAWSVLIAYFRQYERPQDAAVLFAEDSVRSAAAQELMRWKSDEVYRTLLEASRQRATNGLILALGEFRQPESVPLFFTVMKDDLCREEAKAALRKVPDIAQQYAILTVRGTIRPGLYELSALSRRRATLQLLHEFGVTADEWCDLRGFLQDRDTDVVIAAAQIGFRVAPIEDYPDIAKALFRVSSHLNWAQEDDVCRLLEDHRDIARELSHALVREREFRGEHPNWLRSDWRILKHILKGELDNGCSRIA
jgi:hypothetical protein